MRECRLSARTGNGAAIQCDRRVAELAADAWGVLSLAELRACGLTNKMVAIRVRQGYLHRLYRQVYAVGHPNPPWEGQMLAAVKACGPNAVLSHVPAAQLCGFHEDDELWIPEITVVGDSTRAHRGIRVHRTVELADRDWRWLRGIPVTSPARTLLDLAARLDGRPLRSLVRRAQGAKTVNVREICEVMARRGPCRGSRRLANVIAEGPAPTQTVLEDVVLDLILRGGLVRPDVNKPMRIDGRRVIPDFRWPAQRIVVEADGGSWHDNKIAREDDAERQALLEAHGERVLRVTWAQALTEPTQTLARLRAAGAPIDSEVRPHG